VALANATGQAAYLNRTLTKISNENDLAILRPGVGFEVGFDTRAATIFTTFYWRERTMETSEVLDSG